MENFESQIGNLLVQFGTLKNFDPKMKPDEADQTIFCVTQLEKQQIESKKLKIPSNTTFDEKYNFDVTTEGASILLTFWQDKSCESHICPPQIVGTIHVPIIALQHQKIVDQLFKINLTKDSCSLFPATPEIHMKLHYTKTPSKKVSIQDFEPKKVVGRGTFAKVLMVRKKDTQRLYAMKIINKQAVINHNAVKHTISERNILKRIVHPFVVSLKYSFQTEEKLYMVLDYVNGGELFYHLSDAGKFTEDRSRFYIAEIIMALGYLHSLEIVYRDLKPENILLDLDGHICLTDFGLCKEGLGFGNKTFTFCGSPEYLAPEILVGKGYDKAVDWWAVGCVLWEMLCGLVMIVSF